MIDLQNLSKEALLEHIAGLYAEAKPHQDSLAQGAVQIIAGAREVYRRIIEKHLPGVPHSQTRIVTRLSCTTNCLGSPSQELSRRLNNFTAEGVKIVRIEFDEVLHEYIFHAAPLSLPIQPTIE